MLRRLEADRVTSICIRLAPALCPAAGKTTARTRDLLDWVGPLLRDLATRFDARNESCWFSAQVDSGEPGRQAA